METISQQPVVDTDTATSHLFAKGINDVRTAYAQHGASVLHIGSTLVHIREVLAQTEEWESFLDSDQLPFRKRKVQMLVRVYTNLHDLDAQTFACLPPGWSVLDKLARLERSKLLHFVAEGVVTPHTTLKEASALLTGETKRRRENAQQWLTRVMEQLYKRREGWSPEERLHVAETLKGAIPLFLPAAETPVGGERSPCANRALSAISGS